jgi:hypothetical protein
LYGVWGLFLKKSSLKYSSHFNLLSISTWINFFY